MYAGGIAPVFLRAGTSYMTRGTMITKSIVLLVYAAILQSCYYTTQGYYLLTHTYSAKKISRVLEDENTTQDTTNFLEMVVHIQNYAREIGLEGSKKYNTYKELDRDYLVAVVQAAGPLSVEPYKWFYLFMGKLPYKGFYNVEHAQKEAMRLQKQGYDTYVRPVSAFSTLNILPDPIYSFMQSYSEDRLAEVLFHEQMHATIWIKSEDAFSEQLATFIGRKARLQYMIDKYGEDSEELANMHIRTQDATTFRTILWDTKQMLEDVYHDDELTDEQKLAEKHAILRSQQEYMTANYDSLFQSDTYRNTKIDTLNNAFFALISTYESSQDEFEEAFAKCNNDIALFIKNMKPILESRESRKNPYAYLQNLQVTY